jgi:pyruvate-formate lyase-activating enzyme
MAEKKDLVIVYDLPSECMKNLSDETRQKLRTARVKSVKVLHKLGLQCTESVILVPGINVDKVSQAIEKVAQFYSEVSDINENPEIEIIEISTVQKNQYLKIAKRYLDKRINEIAFIAQNLTNNGNSRRRYQIAQLIKEYKHVLNLANSLGLATSYVSDFEQVINYLSDSVQQIN